MADYLNYVLSNPDLRENAEALGLTQSEMKEWGQAHWINHGQNEGRQNSPTEIRQPGGYTEELSEKHYAHPVWEGRSAEDILQQTASGFYKGADVDDYQMWESREGISPDWNLGQFTTQGWNMAADNPYKTGILGDTIEVNTDIGQLVPTTAAGNVGDLRFLQDRYVDEAIANDFPVGWTTPENTWAAAAPGQLGAYWDVLTNAYRTPDGILRRAEDYDPLTAVGPSVSPGPRGGGNVRGGPTGTGTGVGGGLLGNMYEAAYQPRGLLDWEKYQTDPDFVLQENKMNLYQPAALGMGALPVYGMGAGTSNYVNNTTSDGAYTPVMDTITTNTGAGNTTTDSSGNKWIMSPGGQWYRADSDYGKGLLGTGRLFHDPHYDSSGAFIGSEGDTRWGKDKDTGQTGWISRSTGKLETRPAYGIQFPSKETGGFKVVSSDQLFAGEENWARPTTSARLQTKATD